MSGTDRGDRFFVLDSRDLLGVRDDDNKDRDRDRDMSQLKEAQSCCVVLVVVLDYSTEYVAVRSRSNSRLLTSVVPM